MNIPVDPQTAYIWSKNGARGIKAVEVSGNETLVFLDGVSAARGAFLHNSSLRVSPADMDKIAQAWLESRGFTVVKGPIKARIYAEGGNIQDIIANAEIKIINYDMDLPEGGGECAFCHEPLGEGDDDVHPKCAKKDAALVKELTVHVY